jgi:hypothetical protein
MKIADVAQMIDDAAMRGTIQKRVAASASPKSNTARLRNIASSDTQRTLHWCMNVTLHQGAFNIQRTSPAVTLESVATETRIADKIR